MKLAAGYRKCFSALVELIGREQDEWAELVRTLLAASALYLRSARRSPEGCVALREQKRTRTKLYFTVFHAINLEARDGDRWLNRFLAV